ncbi:DNA cytosine methyltransferase [Amycolatopsis sp. DSM 110486]|uniref:DNA cytosine methyltransferase n=1 Tax=Amycolatopsis sp. DSM 110486 TaxID=2865832 RepID=UPI001C69F3EB|nr:DNA (cytosine-5-)-methyltransferase [Amycolatopsis sp. DSM 110486]QYN24052.1 DNA (cytosine-5-)-methyltransferase [Amycolatopsis sp. DSM 110486]
MSETFEVIEICAGAGGQAYGLEKAGFTHRLAVELDHNACTTLRANLPEEVVAEGDVADPEVWNPADHGPDNDLGNRELDLLAGGVPCPPFTIAGKQLGANDERDLFAWAVEQVAVVRPRAVMLENVRGLSMPRFAGYRQHVLDRLTSFGYVAEWRLLHAAGFGVPQLRPRFVLVALQAEYADYFEWPEESEHETTVAEAISDLLGKHGWKDLEDWKKKANKIAPTIVGGSKKHGGADLGPTRAKRAWAELGVDALGLANDAPMPDDKFEGKPGPKLTNEMVARIQGWFGEFSDWTFTGRKTSNYRQIGNAFPPPMAYAVGQAIMRALKKESVASNRQVDQEHDPVYRILRDAKDFLSADQLVQQAELPLGIPELEKRISMLRHDFHVVTKKRDNTIVYKLGEFKAFIGQEDHSRHDVFLKNRAKIS